MSYDRNPGLAAIFSFIFNGLGQFYNGELAKGFWIMLCSSAGMLILIAGAILIGFWLAAKVVFTSQLLLGIALFLLGLTVICVVGIWSIIDAYRCASRK
ncbi:MAG: hypothetical protein WC478_06540 [Candidatus Omnitrophota bacterium]